MTTCLGEENNILDQEINCSNLVFPTQQNTLFCKICNGDKFSYFTDMVWNFIKKNKKIKDCTEFQSIIL